LPPLSSTPTEDAEPTDSSLRFFIHQYRARLHILSRSTKACKREIKSALNLSSQNPSALFLKSSFEYIRKNYRKSVKLLNSCPKTNVRSLIGASLPHTFSQATIHYCSAVTCPLLP